MVSGCWSERAWVLFAGAVKQVWEHVQEAATVRAIMLAFEIIWEFGTQGIDRDVGSGVDKVAGFGPGGGHCCRIWIEGGGLNDVGTWSRG